MSQRRYCRTCKDETLHDSETNVWGQNGNTHPVERAFMGVLTMGISEFSANRKWICQCCGTKTSR